MNNLLYKLKKNWEFFFEKPSQYFPLALFRIGICSCMLVKFLYIFPSALTIYGKSGWINWEITKALCDPWDLHLSDVARFLTIFGLDDTQSVYIVLIGLILSIFFVLIGFFTRYFAILAWFLNYVLNNTIEPFSYGLDCFFYISLFYFTFMPISKNLSVDKYIFKYKEKCSIEATYSLRILQFHVCAIYLSSGFEKLMSSQWQSGNALWFSLMKPQFSQFDFSFLAHFPIIIALSSYFVIIIESFYFIFIWIKKTRLFWLISITALHLGIGVCLGLWIFALTMIVLNWSAFGSQYIEYFFSKKITSLSSQL